MITTSYIGLAIISLLFLGPQTRDGPDWMSELDGSQVVPPTSSAGWAHVRLHYSTDDFYDPHPCVYEISYNDLSSQTTGAHLRWGHTGTNGPNAITLTSDQFSSPSHGYPAIPWSILDSLGSDSLYVVVTTESYPDGEVRGEFINITPPAVEESSWGRVRTRFR